MPPTVILIRHAQALHNVANKYHAIHEYDIPDPKLSDLGLQQCREMRDHLKANLPLVKSVDLIVVSPMRRTLQTATLGLDWLIESGVKVFLDASWQENSDKPCDTGSSLSDIAPEFPNLDFSVVDPLYPEKKSPPGNPYAFTRDAILNRGQTCLQALFERPEKVIAVVSHSGFLRCAISRAHYANADYRVFDFVDASTGKNKETGLFELKQWPLTADNGGGMGVSKKGIASINEKDFPDGNTKENTKDIGEQAQVKGEVTAELP